MALGRFFDRVFAAAGRVLSVDRRSLESALTDKHITIWANLDGDENARWIGMFVTNLLARFYPQLAIIGNDRDVECLRDVAQAINPTITIRDEPGPSEWGIAIGSVDAPAETLAPTAHGWVAGLSDLGHRPHHSGPANPYSACAAACLASAELFRSVFRDRMPDWTPPPQYRVSLLDYTEDGGADLALDSADLEEVAFVGVGAIGSAAIWAMSLHKSLTGRLHLIDHDRVEISNLQRYAITTDLTVGRLKVELAAEILDTTRLEVLQHAQTLEVFASQYESGFSVPTICISVDNVAGRRTAQALLPKTVVNGWTDDIGLGVSWHLFAPSTPCLACLYHPRSVSKSQIELVAEAFGLPHDRVAALWVSGGNPTKQELTAIATRMGVDATVVRSWRGKPLTELYTSVVCGSVALDVAGIGRVEAVPLAHQSMLAGVLMAAELVKRTTPALAKVSQHECLTSWPDVLRPRRGRWATPISNEPRCICEDPDYREVYKQKWGAGTQSF